MNIFNFGNTFYFGNLEVNKNNFPSINLTVGNGTGNLYCLSAEYDPTSDLLVVLPTDCNANKGVICRKVSVSQPACSSSSIYTKQNTFDLLLDPIKQADKKKAIALKKTNFQKMMMRLDQTNAFPALFSSLWYGSLPCYDTKNVTAKTNGERSVLRYCEWKGVPISCAAIFSPYPTDSGMCCSFNMKAADEIYQAGPYPDIINILQKADDASSFTDTTPPASYISKSEPTTLPGSNKGLFLILDAHTDQFATASVDSDFEGFMGLINPSGSFAMMSLEGFQIKPGHLNAVAITASMIDAEDDMKTMDVNDRNCMFSDEISDLQIHQSYTYSNCYFECSLLYAREQVGKVDNDSVPCIPWFFPTPSNLSLYVCNPWDSVKFFEAMNQVPDDYCTNCLPDCSTTLYEPYITTTTFRRCDSSNLGVSRLCNLNNKALPQPTKYGTQVKAEYSSRYLNPSFIGGLESSIRVYSKTLPDGDVFTQNTKTYDAYEKDIALVQVFFRKSTIIQMGRQARMNWIDYFSTVGGLLGLVLGMGIVSFIELFWVCLRLVALKMNFQNLVP